jgi:exodeoxyribonuclease VII small subunit
VAKKKTTDDMPTPPNFEDALAQVAEIVEQLESGELSLGESLQAYELGVKNLQVCHAALTEAERKIEVLAGFDAAGNPITQPFDDTASEQESQVGRRSRESKPAKAPARSKESTVDEARDLF